MVNAFHARTHTYDDTFEEGPTHPGSAIVSAAALASAEAAGAPGRLFLAGVLAGYEVSCRVSAATAPAHYNAGFHTTGTCNAFGACAAASRIYELDPEAAVEALGFAGEGAAGLRQYQISGSMADTAMDGARAAHGGIVAAQLRVAGLPGARGILDGTLGFCAVECSDPAPERLDRDLGSHYDFWATAIEPVSVVPLHARPHRRADRAAQRARDRRRRDRSGAHRDLRALDRGVRPPGAAHQDGRDPQPPVLRGARVGQGAARGRPTSRTSGSPIRAYAPWRRASRSCTTPRSTPRFPRRGRTASA